MITYLNRNEAAARLGVTEQTVSAYITRHWLRGAKVARRWMIPADSVEKLLRSGTPTHMRG